ncbi:hypothetical protein [Burkholderia sp. Ac-20365]|uniref:TetR/AcrR family transcriptional regulator n=1 Tax=Burkholderia sp. Ac-20365 TaxID=2703897 RepID=UPI00197C6455|nr:hypothetical protein [Burkholderia sp. Ac-20365]MBN3759238.1 hypothetical protein [Burkholderia sp. Ac-20365]
MIENLRLADPGFFEAALICFSTYSFERVTIHQISDFTVVRPAVLQAEFGDKTRLLAAVLTWYIDNGFDSMLRQLRKTCCPVSAILCFFRAIGERPPLPGGGGARLLFSTAMRLAGHDSAFAQIVSDAMQKLEIFFYECVVESQEANDRMTRAPAEHVVDLLIGYIAAFPAMPRAKHSGSTVDQVIKSVELLLRRPLA